MCIRLPKKRKEYSLARRASTWGRTTAKRPLQAIGKIIDISTIISPTQGGFHYVTGTDGAADGGPRRPRLLISPAIRKHLQRIYDLTCGKEKDMSRDSFVAFLKSVQGEETISLPAQQESYNFGQFLEHWYIHHGWDVQKPPKDEELDTGWPISNYFISSSHNTYLDGDQFFSDSRPDMYRFVLKNNCRCIEIDVWNGETSGRKTPRNRSKSPLPGRLDHHRHISANSLITPSTAADTIESIKEKLESVKKDITGKGHYLRHESSSQPILPTNETGESQISSDRKHTEERPGRPRELSKASKFSFSKTEPRVLHGWTGTKPTGFRDVCKAIRETGFKSNPLPIIVSLEVHADEEQQEVMVDIMKEEWGGLLLDHPHEACDPLKQQPRLEELLNKILIKVKRPPQKAIVPASGASSFLAPVPTIPLDDDASSEDERVLNHKKTNKVPICPALSALAIYTHSEHFESFESTAAKTPSHIFSISESRILELHGTKKRELLSHNRNFFMRAFPDGMRVDSSNMEPSLYWRKGVQMVALNWQTFDEGMMLNHAMFADTRGWVLKPPGYRSADHGVVAFVKGNPNKTTLLQRNVRLRVTILAGQHIPLPEARIKDGAGVGAGIDKSFRPLVTVKLYVERPEDRSGDSGVEHFYKMKTKHGETIHPDYGKDGYTMEFPEINNVVEQLSFVRFRMEEHSNYLGVTPAAWACFRLDRLKQGYRLIDLFDTKGKPSEGKLFVRVEKVAR